MQNNEVSAGAPGKSLSLLTCFSLVSIKRCATKNPFQFTGYCNELLFEGLNLRLTDTVIDNLQYLRAIFGSPVIVLTLGQQVLTQNSVYHRLVADSGIFGHFSGRLNHRIIEHDGDASFAFGIGNSPAFGRTKIIFVFQSSTLQIVSALSFGCVTSADNAYEIWISVGIGNNKNLSGRTFPHGDPTIFVMIQILNSQGCVVIKHCFSVSQAYAPVLLLVSDILGFVVLNPECFHYAYLICIKKWLGKPFVSEEWIDG